MNYIHLQAELESIANEAKVTYQHNLEPSAASYKLINSINYNVNYLGNKYIVSLKMEDYWKYIEYGRKPGTFPNVNSLIQWIRDKSIPVSGNITEKQLAFVIGKSIKDKGIPAKNILSNTLDNVFYRINKRLSDAFLKDIKEIIKLK